MKYLFHAHVRPVHGRFNKGAKENYNRHAKIIVAKNNLL
jgi:hypothetical protein